VLKFSQNRIASTHTRGVLATLVSQVLTACHSCLGVFKVISVGRRVYFHSMSAMRSVIAANSSSGMLAQIGRSRVRMLANNS